MNKRNMYVEIKEIGKNRYHLTPHNGWSVIIKAKYNIAKGYRQLGKRIDYWRKEDYKKFEFVDIEGKSR